jgi:hypothetical protein
VRQSPFGRECVRPPFLWQKKVLLGGEKKFLWGNENSKGFGEFFGVSGEFFGVSGVLCRFLERILKGPLKRSMLVFGISTMSLVKRSMLVFGISTMSLVQKLFIFQSYTTF